MRKKCCLKVSKFKRLGNVMLFVWRWTYTLHKLCIMIFWLLLLITVTFYNITMSISKTSKSFVKNKKKCNLFHYFHLLNLAIKVSIQLKKYTKKVVIIFNVVLFFKFNLILIVNIFLWSLLVCGKICFDLRWGLCTPLIREIRNSDIYLLHFYTDIYFCYCWIFSNNRK